MINKKTWRYRTLRWASVGMAGLALMAGVLMPATVLAQEGPAPVEEPYVISDCEDPNLDDSNCGIIYYLLLFINGLSALVGIVIVAMITIGGIQYSAAGDNPQATVEAKKRLTNAIFALVMFIFMFAFLQYIVPGGVL